ncbi:hypothetical protein GS563_14330 [Rhodococcus hoagii]|nr:hypothetical protein [Prescottella equi]
MMTTASDPKAGPGASIHQVPTRRRMPTAPSTNALDERGDRLIGQAPYSIANDTPNVAKAASLVRLRIRCVRHVVTAKE